MYLSSDLVENILSRIPAISLARLRYTCKQWRTLISDPRFVNKHLSRMSGGEQKFTVFRNDPTVPSSVGSTVSCVGIDFNEPCLNLEVLRADTSSVYNIFHCDGLLLLVMGTKLVVFNPLLNEEKWINCGYSFQADHSMDAYGIGYISNQSSSYNDYKIVRFRCCSHIFEDLTVEVYAFKSDCWKVVVDVDDKIFEGFYGLPLSNVCLRGTPYWIGYNNYGNRTFSLQSFDFSKERFEPLHTFIHHSPIGSIDWQDSLSLAIFKGDHISLLHESRSTGRIHIWVMKKQWSRLMTVAIPQLPMSPKYSSYFIENNGTVVLSIRLRTGSNSSIYVVGENQKCQKVECYSFMNRAIGGCYYVPSLLQVPGFSSCGEKKNNLDDHIVKSSMFRLFHDLLSYFRSP